MVKIQLISTEPVVGATTITVITTKSMATTSNNQFFDTYQSFLYSSFYKIFSSPYSHLIPILLKSRVHQNFFRTYNFKSILNHFETATYKWSTSLNGIPIKVKSLSQLYCVLLNYFCAASSFFFKDSGISGGGGRGSLRATFTPS